jgi:hypothetical protein
MRARCSSDPPTDPPPVPRRILTNFATDVLPVRDGCPTDFVEDAPPVRDGCPTDFVEDAPPVRDGCPTDPAVDTLRPLQRSPLCPRLQPAGTGTPPITSARFERASPDGFSRRFWGRKNRKKTQKDRAKPMRRMLVLCQLPNDSIENPRSLRRSGTIMIRMQESTYVLLHLNGNASLESKGIFSRGMSGFG